jgi:hypothetical protein
LKGLKKIKGYLPMAIELISHRVIKKEDTLSHLLNFTSKFNINTVSELQIDAIFAHNPNALLEAAMFSGNQKLINLCEKLSQVIYNQWINNNFIKVSELLSTLNELLLIKDFDEISIEDILEIGEDKIQNFRVATLIKESRIEQSLLNFNYDKNLPILLSKLKLLRLYYNSALTSAQSFSA